MEKRRVTPLEPQSPISLDFSDSDRSLVVLSFCLDTNLLSSHQSSLSQTCQHLWMSDVSKLILEISLYVSHVSQLDISSRCLWPQSLHPSICNRNSPRFISLGQFLIEGLVFAEEEVFSQYWYVLKVSTNEEPCRQGINSPARRRKEETFLPVRGSQICDFSQGSQFMNLHSPQLKQPQFSASHQKCV